MVLEVTTKLVKNEIGKNYYFSLHIPAKLAYDSTFPFTEQDDIIVKIVDNSIIIKKKVE